MVNFLRNNNYYYRWQRIKGLFTQKITPSTLNRRKDKRGEYNLWPQRFWKHTIRDENNLEKHIIIQIKDWSSGIECSDDNKFGE